MAKKNENKVAHTGYGEASAAECKEIFEMARQSGMPVMLVGDPGVGKTAMINDYAISHGLGEPWCLIGSTLEPQDMAGLPHAASDAATGVEYTEYLIPPWQKAIMGGKTKVLFLDEFSNSPAAIQAAQLKLIGERRFANGDKIPDDVFIVMAMKISGKRCWPKMILRLSSMAATPAMRDTTERSSQSGSPTLGADMRH